MSLRVAACAYPIERLSGFDHFQEKQAQLVRRACEGGAQLLVFPEYGSMELGAIVGAGPGALSEELQGLEALWPSFVQTYRDLAKQFGVFICAPSFPEAQVSSDTSRMHYRNRVRLHGPEGGEGASEKVMMTRFERELWGIDAGSLQQVFETSLATLGIAVCYDSEFPLLVRRQVDAGAQVMLVPSCTDTLAGYYRVQLSCRARALENQCFVLQAVTVGKAPWSSSVDENTGAAGVFGPVDRGFPSDGVLALGELDQPGWVFADLDLALLAEVRRDGQVKNHADWSQPGHLTGTVGRMVLK